MNCTICGDKYNEANQWSMCYDCFLKSYKEIPKYIPNSQKKKYLLVHMRRRLEM